MVEENYPDNSMICLLIQAYVVAMMSLLLDKKKAPGIS